MRSPCGTPSLLDEGQHVGRPHLSASGLHGVGSARLRRRTCGQVGVAEPDAARLGRGERGFRAGGDHARFFLGNRGEDVDGQSVHGRPIGGDELDAALHQPGHEVDIAGQAVELGDDQDGAMDTRGGQRRGELRPILPAPALHFDELGRDRAKSAGDMDRDGGTLRLQTRAAATLLVGADAVVGNEVGGHAGSASSAASRDIIPSLVDQNLCAQSRSPSVMIRHGSAASLFQA